MDVISFKEARDAKEQVKELQLSTSKRIGDLETKVSAYEGANLHAETLITEESYADANHLPKNAAESVMEVGLEGLTATNLIENGDFSNGTAGWTALDTEDFITSEKEASFTAASRFGAIASSLRHFTSGHKYFIRAVVKTDSSNVAVSLSHKSGYTAGKYSLSGTGSFETAYFIATLPEDAVYARVQIMDYRASDWTQIHVKEVLAIDLTAHGLENYTADEANTMFSNWFDATIHTAGSCRVRSVGKNLIKQIPEAATTNWRVEHIPDGIKVKLLNPNQYYAQHPFLFYVIPNTIYTFSAYQTNYGSSIKYVTIDLYFENGTKETEFATTKLQPSGYITATFATSERTKYIRFRWCRSYPDYGIYECDYTQIQLEPGPTSTPYEPYTETTKYLNAGRPLRSLPNGVADELVGGELVQRVSEGVLLDWSENWQTYPPYDNICYGFLISNWCVGKNVLQGVSNSGIGLSADGNYEVSNSPTRDSFRNICLANDYLYLHVEKSKIDPIEGATVMEKFQNYLSKYPITLTYQLAEPVTHPIETFGTLYSHPSGTIYKDHVHGSVNFYEDGIAVEGLTFSGIDYVAHVDKDTGLYTDITDTCALTAEKNGFTSTALQNGDLVWYELIIDSDTTTSGKLIYSYYDSRYAVVDDTDGKIYRWIVKSTNGVPRLELVEV